MAKSQDGVGAEGIPPAKESAAKVVEPDYTKTTGIQIMCPTTAFPGKPVGTVIENPTPEQVAAALEVKSCVHFILPE